MSPLQWAILAIVLASATPLLVLVALDILWIARGDRQ